MTAVLIGKETAEREWIRFEIVESWNQGIGLVGIWIQGILDQDRNTDTQGRNPFELFTLPDGTKPRTVCKTYNWVTADGRKNLGMWLEEAVEIRWKYGTMRRFPNIPKSARASS